MSKLAYTVHSLEVLGEVLRPPPPFHLEGPENGGNQHLRENFPGRKPDRSRTTSNGGVSTAYQTKSPSSGLHSPIDINIEYRK